MRSIVPRAAGEGSLLLGGLARRHLSIRSHDRSNPMTLTSGRYIGHEQDRGIVQFSMQDGAKEIPCAISTSAMDDLERGPQTRASERAAQFTRLRARIAA